MLGPSFSPSIARIPAPTKSQSRYHLRPRRRASWTRNRSSDRAASSGVSGRPGSATAPSVTVGPSSSCGGVTERPPRSPIDLHPHRVCESATEDVDAVANADEQRPVERLLVNDLERVAWGDAALGEVAKH